MTVELFRKLVFKELSVAEGREFFEQLGEGSSAKAKEYAIKSKKKWEEDRIFTLPQPNLKKKQHSFGINEVADGVKCLNASFSKRHLMIPHVYQDLAEMDIVDPDTLYPSLPLGYKCKLLKNND